MSANDYYQQGPPQQGGYPQQQQGGYGGPPQYPQQVSLHTRRIRPSSRLVTAFLAVAC